MKEQVHGGDVYRYPDVIDFSSNMNPLGTPDSLKQAVIASMERISQYPDVRCERLTEALAAYERVQKEMLICGNGAADLIFSLVQALKPKKALLQAPTFAEYAQALETVDCEIAYFDSSAEGFYVTEKYLEALAKKPDIVFLCNPNNPTGFVLDNDLLVKIADICERQKTFLVVDECFQDFISHDKKFSLKEKCRDHQYLFILKAFTKRYAMAGLRLGYGITGNQTILEKMERITQPWNVSLPAQEAGVAALKETAYVEAGLKMVQTELCWLKEQMKALGLRVYDSQANYLFFEGPANLKEECLKKHLLIRSCSNYPSLGEGFFRIAVKQHKDNVKLIEAFKEIL